MEGLQADPSFMSQHSLGGRDYLAALGVVLIWGTNFVAMKFGLRQLTPFQLGAGRYLFAILPLLLFVRPPKLPARWVLLYGLFQGIGQFGLLFLSLKVGMSAALASVILQTQVFFTAFFGVALLGEHIHRSLKLGLVLAALGLGAFGVAIAGANTAVSPAGFALCLGAASMWAASNIIVRLARKGTPEFEVIPFMVWSSLVPILPFVLLSLAFDPPASRALWSALNWQTVASTAYLGWCATIAGYAMWTGLLKRHPVNRVAPFSLGVPVVGIGAGMLLLGDQISGWQWAGIGLTVAALSAVVLGPRFIRTA